MISYTPQNQLTIESFDTPFERALDRNNRWVRLAQALPWDRLAEIYYKKMNATMGRRSLSARVTIGAVIVKHKLNISDEETIEQIKENPYLQFFLGFQSFKTEGVFDPSLFVTIRERLGLEEFEKFTCVLIEAAETASKNYFSKKKPTSRRKETERSEIATDTEDVKGTDAPGENKIEIGDERTQDNSTQMDMLHVVLSGEATDVSKWEPSFGKEEKQLSEVLQTTHQGNLIVDATVSDQYVKYPTDHGLLNECREKCELIIDILYEGSERKKKPRTYRKNARKAYLRVCRKKKKTRKEIRKAIGKQLRYVRRDLGIIHSLMDSYSGKYIPLDRKTWKLFWVIQEIYRQQEEMYRMKTHRCSDRIVSLYQPHVRPIVRGKEGRDVEFGAQIGVGLHNGYAQVQTVSWDAYHESSDLMGQVESYKRLHGFYPEVVMADQKYWTKDNRQKLKDLGIRCSGKKLGRPKTEGVETKVERKRNRKEHGMRNAIEGKFGQGKNGYGLNEIRAKTPETSESWIMSIFFVMNIIRYMEEMMTTFFVFILQTTRKLLFPHHRQLLMRKNHFHPFRFALLFQ